MPKYRNVNVTCPDCGKSFKVKRFTSIDSDSRQGRMIGNNMLFEEKCPYCHQIHSYPYSFMWRGSGSHVKLVYAVNEEDKKEYLEDYDGEEGVRITDNLDDFNEKRLIFSYGYDDRIIEVEKIIVLKGMQERNPKIQKTGFSLTQDQIGMGTGVIYGESEKQIREIVPADVLYNRLENDIGDQLEGYDEQTLIVDHAWAEKFMAYADIGQDEILKLENGVSDTEEDTGISWFFDHVEELEYSNNEREAASYIIDNFDDIWDEMLKEYDHKPTLNELDEKYDNVINATGDFSMILMNERKYKECMRILKRINDTIDLSDDKLEYMNNRRDYMECLGETNGFEAKLKYLKDWMKEDPEDPYLYGTEINVWLFKDPEAARRLALKYVDTPLKDPADDWLLDSCENVAQETGDQDLKLKIMKRRKETSYF